MVVRALKQFLLGVTFLLFGMYGALPQRWFPVDRFADAVLSLSVCATLGSIYPERARLHDSGRPRSPPRRQSRDREISWEPWGVISGPSQLVGVGPCLVEARLDSALVLLAQDTVESGSSQGRSETVRGRVMLNSLGTRGVNRHPRPPQR